jgi:hypothetical protein
MSEVRFGLSVGGNLPSTKDERGSRSFALKIVDAYELDKELRSVLRPWEYVETRNGFSHRLPRFFYEVPDWDTARDTRLTAHFDLWEFIDSDLHESQALHSWPRYAPCAVTLLAAQLELLREEVNTYIHISSNGGYRSPGHKLSLHASTHCWGTAVNIHRIGSDALDDQKTIEHYAAIARRVMPGVYIRPFGNGISEADDHLHIDLGYLEVIPHNVSEAFQMKEDTQ